MHGVAAATLSDACWSAASRRSTGCARAMPTAACRCCGCRPRRDDLAEIAGAAAQLRDGATDIVFLGTGGSSLGGQTLAQLAGHAVPGVGALRAGAAPAFHGQSRSGDASATLLERLPLATTRFVAISKSGGTGETLMQTIAALAAVKAAGLGARDRELFLGLTEPAKPGKRNGLRDLLGAARRRDARSRHRRRRALFGADQCRPAAGRDPRPRHRARSAPAPRQRSRPCSPSKPAQDVPAAVGAALGVALAESRGKTISVDDGLCRPAGALHPLVRAALGRKPRQGRQGHDADRRARPGRPAQPAAALHRRPARQAVHRHHHRRRPARARASTPSSRRSPASRISPARPSAISSPRRAAPPPRRWPRTAARCAPSTSSGSTSSASANC